MTIPLERFSPDSLAADVTPAAGLTGHDPDDPIVAVLPPQVASQIAAGECVERPASVAKELVENALDAGASRITVELQDGGRTLIRVSDNGRGMSREDLVLAVQRHATSKLQRLEDLDKIETLGFRGEALPSIAAVSRLEIVSARRGAEPNRLVIEGGDVIELTACGAPEGTTVSVQELFFNTPARQKFLRSAQTEFGYVLEHLTRLAIAHHPVAFRVLHNNREALNTPGSPDALNAIVAAYGSETARELVPVRFEDGSLVVHGYVSRPALSRANRTHQSFFVNRRWVRNRTIGHALDQGYRSLLTVGRHPVAALLIEMPPILVDVNVHPTKAEVRFLRDWEVHQSVARAVRDALLAANLVPAPEFGPPAENGSRADSLPPAAGDGPDVRLPWAFPPGTTDGDFPAGPGATEALSLSAGSTQLDLFAYPSERGNGAPGQARETPPACTPLRDARVVGQLHRCYIVAETSGGVVLIDQHAAHERILYEKFLKRTGRVEAQPLVVPITLTLSRREAALALDRLEEFRELGFEMEPFGPATFRVRTAPLLPRRQNIGEILQDLVDELTSADFGRGLQSRRDRIAATMACRAAIKQGDTLSTGEMEALLDDLRAVDNPLELPTNCPHGRPTSILLTLSQVERLFLRT